MKFFLQAMSQASEEGLIFIDGSGPTYATPTVSACSECFLFLCSFSVIMRFGRIGI